MEPTPAYQSQTISTENLEVSLLPRSPYGVRYTPDKIIAGFAFEVQTGTHAFHSDYVSPFVTPPNTLALTPAGCETFSQSQTGGEYLTVSLSAKNTETMFEIPPVCIRQYNNAPNLYATPIAEKLRNQLLFETDDISGIEETALRLFEQTAFKADDLSPHRKPASSLTPKRLRLFHDIVEGSLATTLPLPQIASQLNLSTSFFIRAFKAATGITPHTYVLKRRVNTARQYLRNTDTDLADIAVQTGFANQAHMTTVFQKQFGVTPGSYRRML